MTDKQKSHFGSDGYRELEQRSEMSKRHSKGSPLDKRRSEKEKLVYKYRKEDAKLKGK